MAAKKSKVEGEKKANWPDTNGPWNPARATEEIRKRANAENFTLWRTNHARDQISERGLIIGDVKHVLQNGFVYEDPQESTRRRLYKYLIEGKSPNSNNREIRLVVIPEPGKNGIKVITVMWVDDVLQSK